MSKDELIAELKRLQEILSKEKYNQDFDSDLQRDIFYAEGHVGVLANKLEESKCPQSSQEWRNSQHN